MLGNYIRSLRKEKNLTLAALSAATNLSPGYLSQVERGIADPSLSSLRRIASALDIPAMLLLDDLDSEMLAGYCSMLARRDETILLAGRLTDRLSVADMEPDDILEAMGKLNVLHGKLHALDRTLLQYAEKLGLTPSGRVRLAQQRAKAAAEPEPDGDLFGD